MEKNLILYGPPGTGKTYETVYHALRIVEQDIDSKLLKDPKLREEAMNRYRTHVEKNQVVVCTFHQSYSYEDFVEGIRFNTETRDTR
ncbi:hypothetical protein [Paenibacillus sp. RC67]|uniref:hypothetical protein n=1 Tax=Paenibacillus sp. RC67 TaxID=3039392 RepID=UPI0024ACFC06|nr:hypothetical protein [Paenibacillus sp. RC67]